MGFIQQLMQNNPQLQQAMQQGGMGQAFGQGEPQPNFPQQGMQKRFGQEGLMEAMRGMQTPSMNLPRPGGFEVGRFPQQGGGGLPQNSGAIAQASTRDATGQQNFGSSIQEMIAKMRATMGQQGLGGLFQGGLGQSLQDRFPMSNDQGMRDFLQRQGQQQQPQINPKLLGGLAGQFGSQPQQQQPQVNPRMPTGGTLPWANPQQAQPRPMPQMPQKPSTRQWTGGIQSPAGSTITSTTRDMLPKTMTQPTVQNRLQSKYGNLSGVQRA
jgi:hypothetical protein